MLAEIIFSLFKVNQERVNSFFHAGAVCKLTHRHIYYSAVETTVERVT